MQRRIVLHPYIIQDCDAKVYDNTFIIRLGIPINTLQHLFKSRQIKVRDLINQCVYPLNSGPIPNFLHKFDNRGFDIISIIYYIIKHTLHIQYQS